jgi:hypothetical protein
LENIEVTEEGRSLVMRKPSAAKSQRRIKSGRKSPTAKSAAIASTLEGLHELKVETRKAKQLVEMLESWLRDESGYDEKTWPILTKSLERERKRVGARGLFHG